MIIFQKCPNTDEALIQAQS